MSRILRNVQRYDEGQLISVERYDVGKIGTTERTDEGYIKAFAPVAKIGIMTYYLKDGSTRRELVTEETLFNSDSVNSLKLKPVTNKHPKEKRVDAKNAKFRKVGSVGEIIAPNEKNDHLMASFIVTDQDAITSIDNGRKELSPGYKTDLLLQPGTWTNGENYDAIQLNRRYNHLALCDVARGGDTVALNIDHIDGEEEVGILKNITENKPKGKKPMPTYNLDGIDYEAAQEIINAYKRAVGRVDETNRQLTSTKTKIDELEKKLKASDTKAGALQAKVTELEKVDHTDSVEQLVQQRVKLTTLAKSFKKDDDEINLDEMSNKNIKLYVISKALPAYKIDDDLDDKSLDVVYGVATSSLNTDALEKQQKGAKKSTTTKIGDLDKVRTDAEEKQMNSYKDLSVYNK